MYKLSYTTALCHSKLLLNFLQLLPYFHEWGATGLLVEYEDMFPYSGELEILKASDAYT